MLTERNYGGEFLISKANGNRSMNKGILAASQVVLAGTLLGLVSIGALSAVGAAVAGNTGNGTITASPTVAAGTPAGVYRATCIEPGANVGSFRVEGPDGVEIGTAVVAVAFAGGGLGFTIADGATDFVAGDSFTITVTDAAATAEGQYKVHNPDATDGTQTVAAIAWDATTTGVGETAAITVVDCDAEVDSARIDWGTLDTDEKAAATADLRALGIKVRT